MNTTHCVMEGRPREEIASREGRSKDCLMGGTGVERYGLHISRLPWRFQRRTLRVEAFKGRYRECSYSDYFILVKLPEVRIFVNVDGHG